MRPADIGRMVDAIEKMRVEMGAFISEAAKLNQQIPASDRVTITVPREAKATFAGYADVAAYCDVAATAGDRSICSLGLIPYWANQNRTAGAFLSSHGIG